MINRALATSLLTLVTMATLTAAPLAIQPGEKFTYRLSWGLFRKAATLDIVADHDADGVTRITSHTATQGVIRALYRFDGWGEFLYEAENGRLRSAKAWTETGSKSTNASIDLDYAKMEANYVDHVRPEKSVLLDIPPDEPADFITTLIQTRSWDIGVGEEEKVSVLFDDEFYELIIAVDREEMLTTKWGKKPALVLIPRMEGEPKGMFKRGGEIRVWVSNDELRLPLRFQVKVAVGTAMAILTDYQEDADAKELRARAIPPEVSTEVSN
ncbi:DUF3108 domain-containing protein [Opitutaceae bacterium]|nr:DUF3108 domain-containing protein [Opitutaceae bacterium]